MTKRRSQMTPSQRARHNERARRRYARKAIKKGIDYTPRKYTPKMPVGIQQPASFDLPSFPGESPQDLQRRKWREGYAREAIRSTGTYMPRPPKRDKENLVSEEEYRRRIREVKRMLEEDKK